MSKESDGAAKPQMEQHARGMTRNGSGGIRMKGQRTVMHHLFKSDVQNMKKNVSFQKGLPKIEDVAHSHVFHSVNSQFKEQTMTQQASGHFHLVEWAIGADGTPVVKKVGPPVKYGYVQTPRGPKRRIMPLQWQGEDGEMIIDRHTHKFEYRHSEELTEQGIRDTQHQTSQTIASQMKAVGLEERPAANDA